MENVILSKGSSKENIKRYFKSVLEISKSGKEFPINLDEVWPLVYGKKSDAVEALCKNFMQDVDYQVLRQNPQNLNGGRPSNIYMLTVSCMEFFIARKVRAVFEVYRQVFHGVANGKISLPDFSDPVAAARAWGGREGESQEQQKRIDKQQPYVDFALEAFQSESKVDIGQAAKILHLPFGRNTLFKRLREDGIFFRDRNEPLQKYIDAGYFIVTQLKPIYTESGREIINVKVFCTQKGIAYLNLKYGAGVREMPAPVKQAAIS